jgi:hypothetical protein
MTDKRRTHRRKLITLIAAAVAVLAVSFSPVYIKPASAGYVWSGKVPGEKP